MEFILSIFKSTIICEKQLGKLGYTKIKEETINNWNCYYYWIVIMGIDMWTKTTKPFTTSTK